MQSEIPNEMKFTASPWKWGGLLLMCLIFTWGGFWMLSSEEEKTLAAWIGIGLFGVVGIPLCLAQLIRPGKLTLTEQGFEQNVMGRRLKCNWQDVSDFGVIRINRNKFVSFSRSEDEGKILASISTTMTGGHSGMLGDTFGMNAQDLADIMNAFRDRALKNNRKL